MSMSNICTTQTESIMKKKLTLILFILTILFNLKVSATKGQLNAKGANYVVIGAFSIPKNAIEFTNSAKENNLDAEFSINPERNLFYVYVMATPDHEIAINEAKKLRLGQYLDAWVFSGVLGEDQKINGTDMNPITREKINKIEPSDPIITTNLEQKPLKLEASTTSIIRTENNTSVTSIEEMEPGSKKFLFKIYTEGKKELQGDVDIIDLDKAKPKKIASYRGNEPVSVKPVNKSGNIEFVCEVFGYRKIQTVTNFNQPEATEGITIEENKAVVPFELVRLKKGDFAVMYNVYFYKDAGIMRPESKYEVNSLLDMLKENPKYKIRIHGHTNGNDRGKVISMGESKNFFAITTDVKQGSGSAKKLSEERALVIQSYLINQGIDPSRMQIKAWGGKKPVYEEDHALAQVNVRVEIEILED